jgi:hypothetical protein
MACDKGKLYGELYKCFKLAYLNKKGTVIQSETNKYWATVKDVPNTDELVKRKTIELTNVRRKAEASILTFWSKVCLTTFSRFMT